MKLEIEDVRTRVERKEAELDPQRKLMREWQKMLDLDPGFAFSAKDAMAKEGKEYVVTPDPVNIVGKAVQLLPSSPKIDIPSTAKEQESRLSAEKREMFLTAMHSRINAQSGENFMQELGRLLYSRGTAYAEVLWIRDQLPEKLKKRMFPFSIRKLDPLEVGMHRGPLYVEYAYHKYCMYRIDAKQKWPDLKLWKKKKLDKWGVAVTEAEEVDIIDYWHVDPVAGDVWHCLIVDDEFQIKPVKTNYPFVPIIGSNGENGKSILHAINGLWQYKSRLASTIGTGVAAVVWPKIFFQNEMGQPIPDFDVKPNSHQQVAWGTKFDVIAPSINLPLLNDMYDKVEMAIQQSAFPAVMYGDAGTMQAGYGVNILSQHAGGRIDPFRNSLERTLQDINHMVLALIEEMDDDGDGVEIYGTEQATGKPYRLCLTKEDIQGDYENIVTLKPNVPQDEMQKVTLGMQLVDKKIISKEKMREGYLSIPSPSNEQDRIDLETAFEHPELQKKTATIKVIEAYPETWPAILEGTPLFDIAMKIDLRAAGYSVPPMLEEMMMEAEMKANPMPQGPPPMPPPPGIQPPGMPGPMGGGIPPVMTNQIEPENLGLSPTANPALFANVMGRPLSPMDSARALENAPPMI